MDGYLSWAPVVAFLLAGGLLVGLGRALRAIDDLTVTAGD